MFLASENNEIDNIKSYTFNEIIPAPAGIFFVVKL